MRRVLITGASGANGWAVLNHLLERGWEVAVLLRDPRTAWRIAHLLNRVTIIRGDMENLLAVRAVLERFAADTVVHLAWDGVTASSRDALDQIHNLSNTIDLLKLTIGSGVKHFIGFGSQAEYGRYPGRVNEEVLVRPDTLYGAVKLSTCTIAERIAVASGIRFTWLRLFSSYGPRDNPKFLLPHLITTLLRGKKPALTAGEQIWDYIYFNDAAHAVAAVIESEASGTFNLGGGVARRLRDIICTVRDLVNPQLPLGFGEIAYRPDQVMHLEADVSALSLATGWRPHTDLDTGLSETVKWYRDNMPGSLL